MDPPDREVLNLIPPKKQIGVVEAPHLDLQGREASSDAVRGEPAVTWLPDGGSFRDVGGPFLPPQSEERLVANGLPAATSTTGSPSTSNNEAAASSGHTPAAALSPTVQASPSSITLTAASGEMTTAGTGGMIVDYIGQTAMEEAPDPAIVYRLGQITM